MIHTDPPIQAAVDAGYSVVPADADKRPKVKWGHWQTKRQTPEERDALGHGSIWGLVTGAEYGITVVDFDGEDGAATMDRLGLTPHVVTPGGFHVYVKHPGYPVRNSARKHADLPGLDTRGDGGLAWFAGRSKKGVYTPMTWPPVPIELDPELAEKLFPHPQEQAKLADRGVWEGKTGKGTDEAVRYLRRVCQDIERAPQGGSNAALNKAAFSIGGLVAAGQLAEDYAAHELWNAADRRGAGTPEAVITAGFARGAEKPWKFDPPDEEWIEAVAYKMFRPTAVPEPVPFPTEALPAGLDEFVRAGATAMSCPPDYIGTAILPVFSVAVGGFVTLEMAPGWSESAHVYAAIVGKPGARKSPSLKLAMKPVRDAQGAIFADAKARAIQAEEAGEPDWEEVAPHRLVVDDATVEALFVVLEANERGVLMHSDELTGWVNGMGQYKGGLGRDRQHWLSIWSRDPITVDRKKSTSHFVPNPFVAVLGGIQPEPLSDLMNGRDDGLLPRLLMAQGEFVTPVFRDEGMDQTLVRRYADLWDRVRNEGMVEETVEFTPAGRAAYKHWVNDIHYPTLGKVAPELAGAWSKMDSQAARIALILARIMGTQVTEDVVARALDLVRYYQGQAALILQSTGATSPWEKSQAARVRALAKFINEHPGVTRSELIAMGPEWALDRRTLDRALETLSDLGLWDPK